MTVVKQTRHIFDTCDVLQLRLVCGYRDETERRCDGEVLYQFGARKIQRDQRDWRCPKCGESWRQEFPSNMPPEMREVSPQETASLALLNALETLVGPASGPFKIRFEISGDDEDKTG